MIFCNISLLARAFAHIDCMLIADTGTVTRSISVIRVTPLLLNSRTYMYVCTYVYMYNVHRCEYRNREVRYKSTWVHNQWKSIEVKEFLFEVKYGEMYVLEKLKYRSCNMQQ